MRVSVRKWGNSLALRLPKAIAEDSRIEAGTQVDLTVDSGRVVVTPVSRPTLPLEDLLARVTETNLHGEVASGPPQGREHW